MSGTSHWPNFFSTGDEFEQVLLENFWMERKPTHFPMSSSPISILPLPYFTGMATHLTPLLDDQYPRGARDG